MRVGVRMGVGVRVGVRVRVHVHVRVHVRVNVVCVYATLSSNRCHGVCLQLKT